MTEIIKTGPPPLPPIWAFFCEHEDEKIAMDTGSEEEALSNILDSDDKKFLIFGVENLVSKRLSKSITSAQLRKLFYVVQNGKLSEIRIQLIYIAARQNNITAQNFAQFVKELITQINGDEKRLARFTLFMESVVSYHKYYSKR